LGEEVENMYAATERLENGGRGRKFQERIDVLIRGFEIILKRERLFW
jgi:hypothetical protein